MELVADGVRLVIQAAPDGVRSRALAAAKAEARTSDVAACAVVKAAEEQRYMLAVAYPALRADVAKAKDGHRDVMTPGEVEKTAWEWMARSRSVGFFHAEGAEGGATVVESYIYRNPEPWVMKAADGSTQTVYPGDWLVGLVFDEGTWPVAKALTNGLSPQGVTKRRSPSDELRAQLRRA